MVRFPSLSRTEISVRGARVVPPISDQSTVPSRRCAAGHVAARRFRPRGISRGKTHDFAQLRRFSSSPPTARTRASSSSSSTSQRLSTIELRESDAEGHARIHPDPGRAHAQSASGFRCLRCAAHFARCQTKNKATPRPERVRTQAADGSMSTAGRVRARRKYRRQPPPRWDLGVDGGQSDKDTRRPHRAGGASTEHLASGHESCRRVDRAVRPCMRTASATDNTLTKAFEYFISSWLVSLSCCLLLDIACLACTPRSLVRAYLDDGSLEIDSSKKKSLEIS